MCYNGNVNLFELIRTSIFFKFSVLEVSINFNKLDVLNNQPIIGYIHKYILIYQHKIVR